MFGGRGLGGERVLRNVLLEQVSKAKALDKADRK